MMPPPVVELREWDSNRLLPIAGLNEADRRLARVLGESDGGRLVIDERHDGVYASARSWIGVVRFTDFEVRVVPKLKGGNLDVVRMLDYASGIDALRRYDAARDLETVGDDLVELIAWLFADAVTSLVRDGLLSDYVGREDTLHTLRGRLRPLAQVQKRFGRVDPLEVEYDDFESDIPENQIIAAALEATRSVVRSPLVQRPVRRLHSVLSETCVPSIDPVGDLDSFVYTRRNEHYRPAHSLARLLLRRLAVRDLLTPGGTRSFAFLIDMNELFEAFVTRLVTDALRADNIRVHAQRRDRSIVKDDSTGRTYSAIIPDLLLEGRYRGELVRLPVDAKYKLYDAKKLNEADVYQAFFYAFAYAAETDRSQPSRAVILYPRSGEAADAALRVETHFGMTTARIQALGVDIDGALAAIQAGSVSAASLPALAGLRRVFREVVADVSGEEAWQLASSA
jgi:5-methylcytosine-specific restriction enzyme subunit McrC